MPGPGRMPHWDAWTWTDDDNCWYLLGSLATHDRLSERRIERDASDRRVWWSLHFRNLPDGPAWTGLPHITDDFGNLVPALTLAGSALH